MRVLCISPVFVPVADSEALCSGKVVRALSARGVDTTVLAFELKSDVSLDHSRMWDSLKETTVRVPAPQGKQTLRAGLLSLRYRTASYGRWLDSAVDEVVRLHANKPFDLVYSRSLPMIAHVAAYWISRRLALPWVANINDPWDWHLFPESSYSEGNALQRIVSNYWLRKTLRTADLVTYPSDRLWRFHERVSGVRHAAGVIPHIGVSRDSEMEPAKIVVVHAGKIGKNEATMRSASGFFRALSELIAKDPSLREIVKVVFVGPTDEGTNLTASRLGLAKNVVSTGSVAYEDSLKYIGSANICLLVEGAIREGIYLPSKFVDYVACQKPVLALSPREGTITDLASFDGVYRANPANDAAIEEILARLIASIRNNESSKIAPAAELRARFQESTVTDRLVNGFDGVLERRRKAG